MTSQIRTKPVIGFPVARTNYAQAVQWCLERAERSDRAYAVSAANTHLLSLARRNSEFGAAMRRFDLICPDGMPLVWSLNAQLSGEEKLEDRVYGPSLMLELMKATEQHGSHTHFLLGGTPDVLGVLQDRFESSGIAGVYSPPFGAWSNDELETMRRLIRESGASFVWVGLGCPKQELWIADNLDSLAPAVYFGIGAAFAFHAGEVRQAPALMQKYGLEWLFRLCVEPGRLWKRYVVHNSLFVYYTLRDRLAPASQQGLDAHVAD